MLSGPPYLLFPLHLPNPSLPRRVNRTGRTPLSPPKAQDDLMLESIANSLGESNCPWGQLGSGKVAEADFAYFGVRGR